MASSAGPWFFGIVGSNPTVLNNQLCQTFPIHVELEKYSPSYPQEKKPLGY